MKIITRAEARAYKPPLKRYFTGKRCKHGHVAERKTDKGTCIECARIRDPKRKDRGEYNRAYYDARREEIKARQAAYHRAARAELKALREHGLPEPKTVSEAIARLAAIPAEEAQLTAMITKAATDPIDTKRIAPSIGPASPSRTKRARSRNVTHLNTKTESNRKVRKGGLSA